MAAYIDILRLFAQPELTENRMARKSHTKEIKNKHSSGSVGGAEMGTGAERTRVAVAGRRLAGVWDERGRQSDHQQTQWPHIHA